jgi:HEAT repeat protein
VKVVSRRRWPALLVLLGTCTGLGLAVDLLLRADASDLAGSPALVRSSAVSVPHGGGAAPVDASPSPSGRGTLLSRADSPGQVRAVVRFCATATFTDGPALRQVALGTADPLCAGNAMRALGRLRRVADDPDLLRLLHDPRPRVRDETILALGESGRPEALAALVPFLRHAEGKVRLLASGSIARLRRAATEASAPREPRLRSR